MEENYYCFACKRKLPFFRSEEDSVKEGIYYCTNSKCELNGLQQPQACGQSIVSLGSDGSYTIIRKGAFTQNESNLPLIKKQLEGVLSGLFDFRYARGNETGADIDAICLNCNKKIEVQVTRVVDEFIAKQAKKEEMVWKTYGIQDIVDSLLGSINRKSIRYSKSEMKSRVLLLDATVDIFWAVLLGTNLSALREYISNDGAWFSIAMIAPESIVYLAGVEAESWCRCSSGKRA